MPTERQPATADAVTIISITLEVGGNPALFILLAEDGTINRLGTGAADNVEHVLMIGVTKEPLFPQLREHIAPDWLAHSGAYEIPDQRGQPCQLTILMKYADGHESGLRFCYGTESQGPPSDICQFVLKAVELTNQWYREQKRNMAAEVARHRPWWKFW